MTDWKQIVATVAPGLATVLGGPLAGAAIGALSQAVLGKPDGNESDLAAVISGASPDVLAKIKETEAKLKTDLTNAGIEWEQIAASDRASARQREVETKDNTTKILAFLFVLLYFAMLWAVWKFPVSSDMKDTLNTLIGVLTAALAAIINYYFGSSAGSAEKNAILKKALE